MIGAKIGPAGLVTLSDAEPRNFNSSGPAAREVCYKYDRRHKPRGAYMALMLGKLYEVLLDAGASPEKARDGGVTSLGSWPAAPPNSMSRSQAAGRTVPEAVTDALERDLTTLGPGDPRTSELDLKSGQIGLPPILSHKHLNSDSAFTPESLLREARRQKGTAVEPVPKVCLLDPDATRCGTDTPSRPSTVQAWNFCVAVVSRAFPISQYDGCGPPLNAA